MAVGIYLLKSIAILSIFYGVFYIFLRKDTHFNAKRHYFLGGILAALCFPFLEFTKTLYLESPVTEAVTFANNLPAVQGFTAPAETSFHIELWQVLLTVYLIGVGLLLARLLFQLFSLLNLICTHPSEKRKNYTFVKVNDTVSPFSFFRFIVYNPASHSEEELQMILQHEQVHVSQWHSIDIIAAQIARILQWINPFSWLYKKSLEENLEFIADHKTVSQVPSKKQYQLTLVKASSPLQAPPLTIQFYQSFIKKRIIMLNKSTSKKRNLWKLSIVVPVLALFLWSFNVKEKVVFTETEKMEDIKTPSFRITSESTDAQLDAIEAALNKQAQNSKIRFEDRQRNEQKQLYRFSIKTKFGTALDNGTNVIIGPDNEKLIGNYNFKYGNGAFHFKDLETKHLIKITESGVIGEIPIPIEIKDVIELDKTNNSFNANNSHSPNSINSVLTTASSPVIPANVKVKGTKEFRFTITKNTTDADLEAMKTQLKKEHAIDMKYKVGRNSNNEITSINISYSNNKGRNGNYSIQDDTPIDDFVFFLNDDGESGFWSEAQEARKEKRLERRLMEMEERKEARDKRNVEREIEMEKYKQARDKRNVEREIEMEKLKERMAKKNEEMEERVIEMKERNEELAEHNYHKAKRMKEEKERSMENEIAIINEKNKNGTHLHTDGRDSEDVVVIDKNTSDKALKEIQDGLAAKGTTFTYSKVRRNSAGEITRIKITTYDGKGTKSTTLAIADDGEPINEIIIEY